MNPIALVGNIRSSIYLCPTVIDSLKYLLWLYGDKENIQKITWNNKSHNIHFEFPSPIGHLNIQVRNNQGSDSFIFSEVFQHQYYDFSLSSDPNTILDLGANIGFTAIYFARKYPKAKLACVEPMPSNLEFLRTNLELNGITASIFPSAISTKDGSLHMAIDTKDYGHKVAGIEYGKSIQGDILEVPALSVATLMQELGWERINLLKVDIEGYEAVLLKENCEWLVSVDAICIECHEGYGESDLKDLAEKWGFSNPKLLPGNWLLTRTTEILR